MEDFITTRPDSGKHPLRRRITFLLIVQWLLLTGLFGLVCLSLAPQRDLRAWLVTAVVLGVVYWVLRKNLIGHSTPERGRLSDILGTANLITIARGWLVGLLAGTTLVIAGDPPGADWINWLPALLYLIIGCGDFADGLVARLTLTESDVGKRLDMSIDALGLLVASAAVVILKHLPPWFLLVGLSYYIFQIGLISRRYHGKHLWPLRDRPFGRMMAGIQMVFVGLALMPIFAVPLLYHAALLFTLPFIAGFVWDWLVVIGALSHEKADRWCLFLRRSGSLFARMVRLILLLAGIPAMWAVMAEWPLAAVSWTILWLMMVAGWLGRSAAISATILAAWHLPSDGLTALQWLVFDCTVILIITGTGGGSLWRPEDRIFLKRLLPHGAGPDRPFSTSLSGRRVIQRRHLSALLLIVSAVLYWNAFKDLSFHQAISPLLQWHPGYIAVLLILNAAIIVAMSLRWKLILKQCGYAIGIRLLAAYRVGANAISYLTPGPQFGGEPLQVGMLVHRHNVAAPDATASVAADRLVELCTNCLVLLAGLLFLLPTRPLTAVTGLNGISWLTLVFLVTGLFLMALSLGKTPLSQWIDFICSKYRHWHRLSCISDWIRTTERRTGEMLRQPYRVLTIYIGASLIQWILMICEFWLVYWACGLSLSLTQLIGVVVAARLAFLLPLPGALGALESSQVLILKAFALDPAVGLAVCLITRIRDLLLISAGIGVAWSWLPRGQKPLVRSFYDPI
jgi:uncharacterized protein (TIRG00374 family)